MNELYHHGILGQKWGIRRYQNEDGTRTPEGKERYANYSYKQRMEDRRIYSKGAEKRIEKRINEGEGIKGARSEEANRIERFRQSARTNAKIGKVVGGIAGAGLVLAGAYYTKKIINSNYVTDTTINRFIRDNREAFIVGVRMTPVLMAAGGAVGSGIGKEIGKSGTMIVGGYRPEQFR